MKLGELLAQRMEPRCGECGAVMVLRETTKFRTRAGSPQKFWGCSRFPECRGTHGAHADGKPLGVPGNRETKLARIEAHDAFDRLWKEHGFKRPAAYRWLANRLGIDRDACHIGSFDDATCRKVVAIINENFQEEDTKMKAAKSPRQAGYPSRQIWNAPESDHEAQARV